MFTRAIGPFPVRTRTTRAIAPLSYLASLCIVRIKSFQKGCVFFCSVFTIVCSVSGQFPFSCSVTMILHNPAHNKRGKEQLAAE